MLPYFRSMEAFSHFDFSLYNEIESSKKRPQNLLVKKKVLILRIKTIKYITNEKRLFATMLLFTGILSLTSCSKDDGDWDAMKWEKNNYEEALTPSFGKAIGVPKLGGTYTFKCKNYKNFWIEYVNEQVRDKTIKYVPAYDDKLYSEIKGSYTSSKVEGNTLTVTFAPNETQDGRYVRVEVSAGDISDKIIFVQKPE